MSRAVPSIAFRTQSLWHLHVASAAIKNGAFSAAADACGLTPSAVSQAVASLERRYCCSLMARPPGATPTPAGRLLEARADRAVEFIVLGLRDAAGLSPGRAMQVIRLVSVRRLEALAMLVRLGGFGHAARALGVARPTVHRAVRDLEAAIGIRLFEATSYGVTPTRRAESLARQSSLAFAELRQLDAELKAVRGEAGGSLVVAAMPLARAHLAPTAAELFARSNPGCRITILEGAYDDLLSALRRGDADMIVGALRENLQLSDVTQERLFVDKLSIVMRIGHPLAGKRSISRKDLGKFPWVAPRRDSPLRAIYESLFKDAHPPADIIECNSLSAARSILLQSDRLTLLSRVQIFVEAQAGLLTARPAAGATMSRDIGLSTRTHWMPTSPQKEFLDLIRGLARDLYAKSGA